MTSSGASVAARSASWIRVAARALSSSVAFGSRKAATTSRRRRCRDPSAREPSREAAQPVPRPRQPSRRLRLSPRGFGRPPPSPAATRRPRRPAPSRAAARRRLARTEGAEQVDESTGRELGHRDLHERSDSYAPRLMTRADRIGAPTRIRSIASPPTITASICLPGSRLPTPSARSSDHAALMVAPTSASSNVMSMAKQASVIANGIDGEKPPPGLTSVASATGTAASISVARRREAPELQVEGRRRQQRRGDACAPAIAAIAVGST